MPALIGLLLLLGVSLLGGGSLPFGNPLIPPIGPGSPAGAVCLEESMLDRSTVVLQNIPKPNETNVPFPNSDQCSGGGCSGPDFADYIMAASNVKVERIWPNPPTTRLYKQVLPSDASYDPLRDKVYRPSCNDWCLLNLPYGGTFHCDFIFLLKDGEPLIDRGGEMYPADGAMFDVLLRKDAPIPDKVKCQGATPTPVASKGLPLGSWAITKVFAQESFINYAGSRWIYSEELTLVKWDLRKEAEGREDVWKREGTVFFRSEEYEAFKNLTNKIDLTSDWLYLVKPGVITQVENQPNPYYTFKYLEFRKSPEVRPRAKSLQLGTFQVPTGKGWWRKWVDESKPAIYLYPEKPTALRVKLNPAGQLTVSDPPYDPEKGWEVVAYPDGTLREYETHETHRTYEYLFYEANLERVYVEPKGFVVRGAELVDFFKRELPLWGLNEKETADFIDYWMSRLDKNQPYYFIHFLDNEQIEKLEPLEIYAASEGTTLDRVVPSTEIRLRTYFKALNSPDELGKITPQTAPAIPKREGFTLVEWGGILDQ